MNDGNHGDISSLENQVKELTRSLSLRNASSKNHNPPSTVPPNPSGRDTQVLLERLHEMEERQQWMEDLIAGAGGSNTELEEVRAKRLALEDRQILLEQELQEWKRRLNDDFSEPTQGNTGKTTVKYVCTQCEVFKNEKSRLKHLETELNEKIYEFELEKALVESEKCWIEKEKNLLKENQLLEMIRREEEKKTNQHCKKCERIPDIEKLESTLCKNLNELAEKRAAIEGEMAWIDCVKGEVEKSRHELNEQRKEMETARRELENQRKVIAQQKQQMSRVSPNVSDSNSSSNSSRYDIDILKQRELLVTKKSQELHELQTKLEKEKNKIDLGRIQMEKQWEQLFHVQKTLDAQKSEVDRERKKIAHAKSLTEWEKKLNMENENLVLEKMKLKKEEEILRRKQQEIESNFNMLELQMQARSELEGPMIPGRAKNRARKPTEKM